MVAGEVLVRILPVFGLVAVGAAVGRLRPLPERATRALADYLVYAGIPLLVLVSIARLPLGGREAAGVVGVAASAVVGVALAVVLGARLLGLDPRRTVLPAMLMNCGNLGYPVNRAAFGPVGGQTAVLYYVTVSLLAFTLGVALVARRAPVAEVLRLPLVWAALAGGAANLAGVAVPAVAEDAAALLSLPFLLFLLGHDVAHLPGAAWGEGAAVGLVRVAGGGLLGAAAAALLLPPGVVRSVAVVESAMPSAVMAFLLARRYGAAPEVAAASVVATTAAAPLVLPVVIWLSAG